MTSLWPQISNVQRPVSSPKEAEEVVEAEVEKTILPNPPVKSWRMLFGLFRVVEKMESPFLD